MKKNPLGALLLLALSTAVTTAQEPATPATPPASETPAAEAPAPAADRAADLLAAAEKLAAAPSFAWSQTASFGNGEPRTTTGKKGSGGFMLVTLPGRDREIQVLSRKGKAAIQGDDEWTVANAEAEGEGAGRWIARMVLNLREPTVEAKELVAKVSDLKFENGGFRGTLPEAAARELMSFRGGFGRRGGGGGGGGGGTPPEITGAGGSVTFTVADGVLTGYETTVTGRMSFNGQDRDIGRTTKVEITGLGSTTFDIPESAAALFME